MSDLEPVGSSAEKALILLGAPHSGISIVSEVLARLTQTPVDGRSDAASSKVNLAGIEAVTELNECILEDLRIRWDLPFLLIGINDSLTDSRSQIEAVIRERYLDKAVLTLRGLAASGHPVVLVDFRVSLFLPLWQEACALAGLTPLCGFIHRNPITTLNVLRAEANLGMARGQQIWLRYNIEALVALLHLDNYFILSYEDLISGEEDGLLSLARGLNVMPTTLAEQIQIIIRSNQPNDEASSLELAHSTTVSYLVKEAYSLIETWSSSSIKRRTEALADLRSRHDDYSRFSGNLISVQYNKVTRVSLQNTTSKRYLLLHYHLFKNAGTSVDAILKKNFGKLWQNIEFLPPGQEDHAKAIATFVAEHPDLIAISSHTLFCSPPVFENTDVMPIIFMRHPLKRLRSAYDFERKQAAETLGAQLARNTDFISYVRTRLTTFGDRSFHNFQTYRLARLLPNDDRSERERAFAALDQLPFVGLVEEFGKSLSKLKAIIQPRISSFQIYDAWENATSGKSHDENAPKPPSLQDELGDETYAKVLKANQDDIALYEELVRRYAMLAPSS